MRAKTKARIRTGIPRIVSQRPASQQTRKKPTGRKTGKLPAARPTTGPKMKPAAKRPPRLPKRVPANVGRAAVPAEKAVPVQPFEPVRAPVQQLDLGKEKTVTVKEAAFRLKKTADTVYHWLRSGRLRGWQDGVFHGFRPTPYSRCFYTVSGRLLSLATPRPSPLDGRVF